MTRWRLRWRSRCWPTSKSPMKPNTQYTIQIPNTQYKYTIKNKKMGENPFFLFVFTTLKLKAKRTKKVPKSNPCLRKFKCVIGARGRVCPLIARKTAAIVRTVPHDSMRRPLQSRIKRIREQRRRRRQEPHSPLPLWSCTLWVPCPRLRGRYLRFLQVVALLCRLSQTTN